MDTHPARAPRATDTFHTVAWRAPTARRFDGRPANDHAANRHMVEGRTLKQDLAALPQWAVIAAAALIAALTGAMLGGMLHI